jgi:hypothetical protein
LKLFDGKDATDAFHSLHSAEAKQRMAKLKGPAVSPKELAALTKPSKVRIPCRNSFEGEMRVSVHSKIYLFTFHRPSLHTHCLARLQVALAFRQFRSELIAGGWFQRNLLQEAWLLSIILACACGGTYLAHSHPLTAVLLLALAMQQANYFAHDLVHGHGNGCWWVGNLVGGIVCGYSRVWWSDTHNKYV